MKKILITLAFIAWATLAQSQEFYTAKSLAIGETDAKGRWQFGDWEDTDIKIFFTDDILYIDNEGEIKITITGKHLYDQSEYTYSQIGWYAHDQKGRSCILKFRVEKENGVKLPGINIYLLYDNGLGVVYHAKKD